MDRIGAVEASPFWLRGSSLRWRRLVETPQPRTLLDDTGRACLIRRQSYAAGRRIQHGRANDSSGSHEAALAGEHVGDLVGRPGPVAARRTTLVDPCSGHVFSYRRDCGGGGRVAKPEASSIDGDTPGPKNAFLKPPRTLLGLANIVAADKIAVFAKVVAATVNIAVGRSDSTPRRFPRASVPNK